jgi:hypothetical protein
MMMNLMKSRRGAGAKIPLGGLLGIGLASAAVGAALTYWFDPQAGRRRRAHFRDRAIHGVHEAEKTIEQGVRDLRHRTRGAVVEAVRRGREREGLIENDVLEQRVRSELGRLCSHPRVVEVTASDGIVTLRGPILTTERKHMVRGVMRVVGVHRVEDHLEPHQDSENFPALQGPRHYRPERTQVLERFWRRVWAPGPRLVAGAAGIGLIGVGYRRRSVLGLGAELAGLLLLARSANNPSGVEPPGWVTEAEATRH